MKNKSGITLIALIITIIVMLILVAVSVQILIKSDLIGTAESAGEAYKTAHGKEQTLKEVTINGKTYASIEEYRKEQEGNGGEEDTPLEHSGIIPEGGIYKKYIGEDNIRKEEDYEEINGNGVNTKFPEIITIGDIYCYGDYEYCYVEVWCWNCDAWIHSEGCSCDDWADFPTGWTVRCKSKVSEPGRIISKINGVNVTTMCGTFAGNTLLKTAPKIPNSVINMEEAFHDCTSLVTAPEIPNSVTTMPRTFYGCTSLETAPEIPNSVKDIGGTFEGCISLEKAPKIPNSVTHMSGSFRGCTSLKTVSEIPSSVKYMYGTFEDCSSLTGTITINANPTLYSYCFNGIDFAAQEITLTGSSTVLDEIGATGTNYCPDCNGGNCGC